MRGRSRWNSIRHALELGEAGDGHMEVRSITLSVKVFDSVHDRSKQRKSPGVQRSLPGNSSSLVLSSVPPPVQTARKLRGASHCVVHRLQQDAGPGPQPPRTRDSGCGCPSR